MKLTPELIEASPSFINALKDRELDLRGECGRFIHYGPLSHVLSGHKIPAIENLGVTKVRITSSFLQPSC